MTQYKPALPLTRAHMPTDYAISLKNYTKNFTVVIPDDFGPKQDLPGFEDRYQNIVDYIVRITYQIWDERDIEYIGKCYSSDSRVFDDYGLQIGSEKIIQDTYGTTGAYSDIALVAEECIWAGTPETGFRSSHRVAMRGTNDADSKYAPKTGNKVDFMAIANCVSRDNDIFLEHVLYNTSELLMDLGLDPIAEAKKLAQNPAPGWPRSADTWASLRSEGAPAKPISVTEPVDGFDADAFARAYNTALWQDRDFDAVQSMTTSDIQYRATSKRRASDFAGYQSKYQAMFNAITVDHFQVDEVYWMGNDAEGYAISTRWSMDATHIGGDIWGDNSGAPLQIWGISEQYVKDGEIYEEHSLINELDIMMQVAKALQ